MKKNKKVQKKRRGLKIFIGVILSIAIVCLAAALVNKLLQVKMNEYIDSFSAVEAEDRLVPKLDENGVYYFETDRDFKVMQLTDIHIGGGFLSVDEDKKAINAVAAMITAENPDLVIVTGDISFAVPYISGTINNSIAHSLFKRTMERLGVYWTVNFGNHDSEIYNYYGRESVGEMYTDETLNFCLFSVDGELSGEGNHHINVKNSRGFITETFYMIDTHSYTDKDPLGLLWDYDYVKEDQIDWYRGTVEVNKQYNAEIYNALPDDEKAKYTNLLNPESLMFMHIPLREVKVAYDEYVNNGRQNTDNVEFISGNDGESDEIVFCSRTDENLFETVKELGSTAALFFGHDHLNNFVLSYQGITLSYGYSIDYLAYSGIDKEGFQRGCTIIICSMRRPADITHENYYQDIYPSQYEKESVNLAK